MPWIAAIAWIPLAAVAIGALGGAWILRRWLCPGGGCPLTGSPWGGALFGGLLGLVVGLAAMDAMEAPRIELDAPTVREVEASPTTATAARDQRGGENEAVGLPAAPVDRPKALEAGTGGGLYHLDAGRSLREVAGEGLALVVFSATWCPPCKQYAPILEAEAADGVMPVWKVDVDTHRDLAKRLNIRALPTTVLWRDGVEQGRAEGLLPAKVVRSILHPKATGSDSDLGQPRRR